MSNVFLLNKWRPSASEKCPVTRRVRTAASGVGQNFYMPGVRSARRQRDGAPMRSVGFTTELWGPVLFGPLLGDVDQA